MSEGELSNLDLEGRLAAQRQVISWLLSRHIRSREDLDDLRAHLDEAVPPHDHQEDPGAVPTEGHAALTAAGLELRMLLEPLERELDTRSKETRDE